MITTSAGFNEQIESGNRDYQMLITCTLTSGTVLTIDNSRVWSQGYSYDDALCTEPDALEIGTAIINKMTLVINNMDEHYSAYDFGDATLNVQIGLATDDGISYISKGTYTVSNAVYDTTLITLTALDNMYKFDTLYQTIPTVPSTVMAIVQDACTACGVTLGVKTFDGADTVVSVAPTKDDTYRQMLAWTGQMIGCSWRINNAGELMPVWYNITALGQFYDGGTFAYNDGAVLDGGTFAYDDGDTVDGGSFNDSSYFIIRSLATAQVAVDDTIITGITIRIENLPQEGSEEAEPTFTDYSTGEPGIVLLIEANPLITADNVQSVLTVLGQRLIEMKYRKGQLLHLSDPRLEAGDVFVYADHKGHAYPMICSQAVFQLGEHQSTTSASPVPLRKAAERYSAQAQTTVQIHKSVQREKNLRETAEAELKDAIDNAPGLYMSTETEDGATVYILHNKPTKAESTIVWKMSSQAVGVSTNGGQTYNAGLKADGTAIVQRLYSNTITAGIIQSPDYAYTAGDVFSTAGMLVDLANNTIRSKNFTILPDGTTYINGNVTLGGANNVSGVLNVKDANGTTIGTWENNGLSVWTKNGKFIVDSTDYVTITRSAGQSASPSMLTLIDLTDYYIADLRASQLALKPYSSAIYTATLNAFSGGQLFLNSTANQLYGIRLIGNTSSTSGEYVPQITLQGTTSATVGVYSSNPTIRFSNLNASQNIALVFTDKDAVQAPASLTLAGNQGGEYFIAPNIKVTSGLEVGAAKFYTPSEATATNSGSYITSGSITVHRRGNVGHIYGNVTIGSAVASQTTIATIPDGYRPVTTDFFSATNGSFFRVNSNGTLQAQNALTAGNYYFSTTYPLA